MPVSIEVIHGDCVVEIPKLAASGVVVDAVVCDPPYHLTPTVKRFGKEGSAPAQFGKDGAMARLSSGFMSAKWDGGDLAFRPETWATVGSIMRPGAFLVAFGGTRTYHRLTCAIEDAGFVIQDCLMFMFGTGFPKRRDMLKPAFEPIVLAYKPGGKRTMQVDECRIGDFTSERTVSTGEVISENVAMSGPNYGRIKTGEIVAGRWPANVCHDGGDEVVACFPQSTGSVGEFRRVASKDYESTVQIAGRNQEIAGVGYGDTGSAARFFFSAKAGAEDRWGSKHPTVKPVELIRWLVKLVVPPGGLFIDPFAGSGTAAVAALAESRNAILIEREDQYISDIRERIAFYEGGDRHSVVSKARRVSIPRNDAPLFDHMDAAE